MTSEEREELLELVRDQERLLMARTAAAGDLKPQCEPSAAWIPPSLGHAPSYDKAPPAPGPQPVSGSPLVWPT
jgi:hypothetical protein